MMLRDLFTKIQNVPDRLNFKDKHIDQWVKFRVSYHQTEFD